MDAKQRTSSVLLFNTLEWIPLYEEVKVDKRSIVHKHMYNNNVPTYLTNFLIRNCKIHDKNTRYPNCNIICPKYKCMNDGGRTFTVTAVQLWNSLPISLKKKPTLKALKRSFYDQIFEDQLNLYNFNV